MNVDISGIETDVLQALAGVLLGFGIWLIKVLAAHFSQVISSAQVQAWDDALNKLLALGFSKSNELIKDKGWDHVDVKNAVIGVAASEAASKFPAALKGVGINPTNLTAVAETKIQDALTRAYPNAASSAAYSVVTPPAPPIIAVATAAPAAA